MTNEISITNTNAIATNDEKILTKEELKVLACSGRVVYEKYESDIRDALLTTDTQGARCAFFTYQMGIEASKNMTAFTELLADEGIVMRFALNDTNIFHAAAKFLGKIANKELGGRISKIATICRRAQIDGVALGEIQTWITRMGGFSNAYKITKGSTWKETTTATNDNDSDSDEAQAENFWLEVHDATGFKGVLVVPSKKLSRLLEVGELLSLEEWKRRQSNASGVAPASDDHNDLVSINDNQVMVASNG